MENFETLINTFSLKCLLFMVIVSIVTSLRSVQEYLMGYRIGFYVCRSDFLKAGVSTTLVDKENGDFDKAMFEHYLQSDIQVLRSPDRALFRVYRPVRCQLNASVANESIQAIFDRCIELKALHEAPHKQLASLAFGSKQQRDKIARQEEIDLKEGSQEVYPAQ